MVGLQCYQSNIHLHSYILYALCDFTFCAVFLGKLLSMRHLKNEVESIKTDVECGLMFSDTEFTPQPGDEVICYHMVEVPQTLEWDLGF